VLGGRKFLIIEAALCLLPKVDDLDVKIDPREVALHKKESSRTDFVI